MPLSSSFGAYFGGTTGLHGLIQSSISCDPDRQNKRVRQHFKEEKGIDLTYGVIQCQTADDHTAVQSKKDKYNQMSPCKPEFGCSQQTFF